MALSIVPILVGKAIDLALSFVKPSKTPKGKAAKASVWVVAVLLAYGLAVQPVAAFYGIPLPPLTMEMVGNLLEMLLSSL